MITLRIALAATSRLLRSRLLIVTVLIGLVYVIMMAAPIGEISELKEGGEFVDALDMKAMWMHMAITGMEWMANLVALFLGSTVIHQEIKDGTIFSILSKPVSRLQYFIGSFLGAAFCLCIVWCIFGLVWAWFIYAVDKSIQPLHVSIFCSEVIKSLLMLSLSLAWSQRFSPWLAGVLALLTFDGETMAKHAVGSLAFLHLSPPAMFVKICAFPFPCFQGFDALLNQLGQTSLEPVELTWPFIHMVDFVAVALLFAWFCFRKQDLISNS